MIVCNRYFSLNFYVMIKMVTKIRQNYTNTWAWLYASCSLTVIVLFGWFLVGLYVKTAFLAFDAIFFLIKNRVFSEKISLPENCREGFIFPSVVKFYVTLARLKKLGLIKPRRHGVPMWPNSYLDSNLWSVSRSEQLQFSHFWNFSLSSCAVNLDFMAWFFSFVNCSFASYVHN